MEKAHRGQIAVVEVTRSHTTHDYGTVEKVRHFLVLVMGVSKECLIIRYQILGDNFVRKETPDKSLLVNKGLIDEAALIRDMEAKVKANWDANSFNDLESVKKYVKQFKVPVKARKGTK